MKKVLSIILAVLTSAVVWAQQPTGGVTGTVVNRVGRAPISGATLELSQGGSVVASGVSDSAGKFLVEDLENGVYSMSVRAEGYNDILVNVTVDNGFVKDMVFVSLTAETKTADIDESSFSDFDLTDSGYNESPSILYNSNDPYNEVAGFGFSNVRFKNRGYNSESQDVYFSGVPLNDAITGYSPYSLWTGLNEVVRAKDNVTGLATSDYGVGGYNGGTNIYGNPANVRQGLRASVLTNSAAYRLRLMLTYGSGPLDNGWSYAISASARLGGNDYVKGVFYRSFAYYLGAEKKFDDEHRLAIMHFATPGTRGTQNASTQEVYDLMGDNMYNSNWGYQNGKIRNSRERRTFEPVTVLKYTYSPSFELESTTTFLWRTGFNGYTALDWYDASDPRPDYYRNLPSYAFMAEDAEVTGADVNRNNEEKAEWMTNAWTSRSEDYMCYQHVDWNRLYNVNYLNGGRSKYVQEERHVDQNDLNLAQTIKYRPDSRTTINAGVNLRFNTTENYKKMADLLGGMYFLNVDSFAERDFAINEAKIQNDLDYFLSKGRTQKIHLGDKYGYDYRSNVVQGRAWASVSQTVKNFEYNIAASLGYESFWRTGLLRKGLFAGVDDNGQDIYYNGENLTIRDAKGRVVTSKGNSEYKQFFVGSVKAALAYNFPGGHRIYANGSFISDAPKFNEAFLSPRTRNSIIDNLQNKLIASGDINYMYSNKGYQVRATFFATKIMNQSKVMSFYDDSQNSFTNFAMTGIDQRHLGMELGFKIPLYNGLSLSGALSWGDYIYVGTPHMVQTVDNSAEVVSEGDVPYWSYTPQFRIYDIHPDGTIEYDEGHDGKPIEIGRDYHHVASTPQIAAQLSLNYNYKYWFFELGAQCYAQSYLEMNPLYRTNLACKGGTAEIIREMTSQELLNEKPVFLLNASIGKSWYVRNNQIGFSLQLNNITHNTGVKTGGYEQTRLMSSADKSRYYRYDSKYFYMPGFNYMLNLYFRF